MKLENCGCVPKLRDVHKDGCYMDTVIVGVEHCVRHSEENVVRLENERDELKYRLQVWDDAHAEQLVIFEDESHAACADTLRGLVKRLEELVSACIIGKRYTTNEPQ